MEKKVLRIGCSSAFWGDSASGAWQLVMKEGPKLHYLVADYLAEVTMGILARSKDKGAATGGSGEGGYVAEFASVVWKPLMRQIMKHKIKLVTNAGGMNPLGLKAAIEKVARDAGLEVPVVAAITGDDLAAQVVSLKNKWFCGFRRIARRRRTQMARKSSMQNDELQCILWSFPHR